MDRRCARLLGGRNRAPWSAVQVSVNFANGSFILIFVIFSSASPWDMSDADLSAWNSLLAYATEGAARYLSHSEFLEYLVKHIDRRHIATYVSYNSYQHHSNSAFYRLSSIVRVGDYLLSAFDRTIEQSTSLPSSFMDLIHDILTTSYPPPPRNKLFAIWMLRSLSQIISNCPSDLLVELLENLLEGLVIWITDDYGLFTSEEYTSDIIPLYETIMVSLQSSPPTADVLQSLSVLVASALRVDTVTGSIKPEREEALIAFSEFWSNNCQHLQEPRGGWAEGVVHALELAFPPEVVTTVYDEVESEDELDILHPAMTPRRCLNKAIVLPPSPSPMRIRGIKATSSVSGRPAAKRARLSEPTRLPALFVDSPPSPTVQKSKRTRSRALSSSYEKENVAPMVVGEDVDEDDVIFLGMKRSPAKSAPATKHTRILTGGSDDSEDARAVEAAIRVEQGPCSPVRRPLASAMGWANTSTCAPPPPGVTTKATPTKRVRVGTAVVSPARTPLAPVSSSPVKRRKTSCPATVSALSQPLSIGSKRHRSQYVDEDDDDWLPPSSDPESEDEPESDMDACMDALPELIDDLSSSSSSGGSSSSPVRTPRTHLQRSVRVARYDLRNQVGSDGVKVMSSPSRKTVRRVSAAPLPHSKGVTPLASRVLGPVPTSPLI